jgi:hypothetical protein
LRQQWQRKLRLSNAKVKPLHWLLLVIVVILTYKIIIKLVEYRPPMPY